MSDHTVTVILHMDEDDALVFAQDAERYHDVALACAGENYWVEVRSVGTLPDVQELESANS